MITPAQLEEWKSLCQSIPIPQMINSEWGNIRESSQDRFIRQATRALPTLIIEVEHLKELLRKAIMVAEEFGDFSNGITDGYGTTDEGRVMSRNFYKKIREEAGI